MKNKLLKNPIELNQIFLLIIQLKITMNKKLT